MAAILCNIQDNFLFLEKMEGVLNITLNYIIYMRALPIPYVI